MSESAVDGTAFETYVLPEIALLLRVARSLTRHHAEAEDLVQDTLVRAYRGIDSFDGRHPRAWLLTIMRNSQINRNRRRRPELLRDPDSPTASPAPSTAGERPDAWVEHVIDADILRALGHLNERFRQVIELVDIDGLSYAEASQALGVPLGTVMSRLHRGRSTLRAQLELTGFVVGGRR